MVNPNQINVTHLSNWERHNSMPLSAGLVSIGDPKLEQWAGWDFADYTLGYERPHYPVPAPYYNCYDSELGIFLTVRNRDGNDVVVIDGWPNQGARQVVSITVD